MKQIVIIFLFLIFSINHIFAEVVPCSYVSDTNSQMKYKDLNDFIKDKNNKLKDYWKDEIKPIINNIKEESNKREEKLKTLKNIEKERTLVNKKIEFLLQQENELLSNLIGIESEK